MTILYFGTNPKGQPVSKPIALEDVPAFVTHCLVDGWRALTVFDGLRPLGGIERNPRRLWLTKEAVS